MSVTDPGDAATADAIRAHLAGLRLDLVDGAGQPSAAGAPAWPAGCRARADATTLAAVCVERGPSGELLVYLTEGEGATTLVRRIPAEPRSSGATLEEVGLAVRSLVEGLLDGGHVGIAQPGAPSVAAPTTLGVRVGYAGTLLSSDTGWQSGIDLAVLWRFRGPLALRLGYGFFSSVSALVPGSDAVLMLERHPIELAAGWAPGAPLGPEAWLGTWADSIHRTTTETADGLRATTDRSDWSVGLFAEGGVAWSPFTPVHVHLLGGLDLALQETRYVVESGGGLSLSRVRPRVDAGIGLDVW